MSYPIYMVPAGDVIPHLFATFDGGTGASTTMTGFAVTDIEVYKDGSATQRASDAGYTLLDTDGIDFDGITGIHGFSIDTGDNTDAGFYTVGSWFHVVISAITVDGQTVSFVAFAFRLMAAEGVAGVPDVNATHWNDTAVTTPPAVNATQISGDSGAADNAEAFFDGTGYSPAVPNGAPLFGILAAGTLSGTHSSTTADLGTNAPANDIVGCVLYFPAHALRVFVDSYNTGTGVATFSPATGVTLTNGNVWILYVAPKESDILPRVNTTQIEGVDATNQLDAHSGLNAAGVRSAVGLASANLDTQLGDLPTNAELNAALAAADDAVLAAIADLDTVVDRVETDTQDIQARLPASLNNGYMRSSVDAGLGVTWQEGGVGNKDIGPAT